GIGVERLPVPHPMYCTIVVPASVPIARPQARRRECVGMLVLAERSEEQFAARAPHFNGVEPAGRRRDGLHPHRAGRRSIALPDLAATRRILDEEEQLLTDSREMLRGVRRLAFRELLQTDRASRRSIASPQLALVVDPGQE